jgi:hypothetical protein
MKKRKTCRESAIENSMNNLKIQEGKNKIWNKHKKTENK